MNASVRCLFVVVFFMFLPCGAMETGDFKPFDMDIDTIEDIPSYCASLVKLLAEQPKYWKTDEGELPTFSLYDGPICTFLNKWAFQGEKHALKLRYPWQETDPYKTNFLILEGTVDPHVLEKIEGKYRQKIEELQRGWKRLNRRGRSSKEPAVNFLVKESMVADEPKVIRFLASTFGFIPPYFECGLYHQDLIHIMVKADKWDRFQQVFRLQIDEVGTRKGEEGSQE